jgi:hypothetical protein
MTSITGPPAATTAAVRPDAAAPAGIDAQPGAGDRPAAVPGVVMTVCVAPGVLPGAVRLFSINVYGPARRRR